MKKRIFSALLALTMCLALLPTTVSAAESDLPDWYFLFAIFKNVNADSKDGDGKAVHAKYSMTQDEINTVRTNARQFAAYLNKLGVMRAHVDVIEIDATVTEFKETATGPYLASEQAALLLKDKVDLDKYDHVTGSISLNISTGYVGKTGSGFENGTGYACINLENREYCLKTFLSSETDWPCSTYIHELLHFMEDLNQKWGAAFDLHEIEGGFYTQGSQKREEKRKLCYTDIIFNRARGTAGTGVAPTSWLYPPHVLRSASEFTVPSSVAGIGSNAFRDYTNLTGITFSPGVTSIGDRACWGLSALTRVTIPTSLTSIGYAAFWDTGVKEVYYSGSEAQWKAIAMGEYNGTLTKANIHYNSLMADVKTTDWFARPVAWAMEKGIAAGTGEGRFSPDATCTQGQILTFLWRANGEPAPSGKVSGTQYYAAAVQWAKERGLTGEKLAPDSSCTRSDVVTYLWKLAGSPSAGNADFSDVSGGASYAQAVAWAVEQKITSGTGNGRFSPDAACTRGQIVTFLYSAFAK